jgi:hypothetical protein
MPGGYWGGLVEGFQGRREGALKENYDKEVANRAMSDRVFQYLLASRDPELQQLALSGLMNPIDKKKGFAGFMGGYESNPFISQVVGRMNEMVPEDQPATPAPPTAPTPAAGQSGAMSTNVATEPGGYAPQLDFAPPPGYAEQADFQGAPAPGMQTPPMGAMGGPPPPPMESKFKRRGTGVPTAEEVAEATAAAQQNGRIKTAVAQLQKAGATPEEIQDAIMGMLGAPRNQRQLSAINNWGVRLAPGGPVLPVLLDQGKQGYVMANGQPIPPTAEMVRMSGSGGGVPRTAKEPDPSSSTGWSRVFYDTATGAELYRVDDTPFVPPPAYTGTTTIADPANPTVPVRAPILRSGGTGAPLGDDPTLVESQTQVDAQALQKAVDAQLTLAMSGAMGRLRQITPQQRDQVVQDLAKAQNLPYQTYDDLVRAATSTPPVSARQKAEGGTMADKVRQRALQNRQGGGAPAPPPPAPNKPTMPSARSQGPGPVGAGRR